MSNEYDRGESVKISAGFTDLESAAFDPDTVTLVVKDPDGEETEYVYGVGDVIVRDDEGNFHAWIGTEDPTAGDWRYRWRGTATVDAGTIKISKSGAFTTTDEYADA